MEMVVVKMLIGSVVTMMVVMMTVSVHTGCVTVT